MSILSQRPEGEILGMGGPWIGQITWNGRKLPGDYLMQQEVTDPKGQYAALVGTNQRSAKARGQVTFWIVIVTLRDGTLCRSRASWPALYIEDIVDGQIGYYSLFYAGKPEQKHYLPFELAELFEPVV